ncbi:MAG: SpoIIE family protein phosphatase [Bacteroidales bacterium]|nr:SpoIIE family protein phosphatase [Bacteroidales bacterium]
MRFVSKKKIFYSTIGCLFLFSVLTNGQTYRFKNYGTDSKIPDRFIYTLNQDNNGFLWVGTGAGLARFDGFDFYEVFFPDSAAGRYPTVSLKDKNGTIWYGCNDGSVYYTEEGNLKTLSLSNTRSITDLLEGPDGFIYVIPQGNNIFSINPIRTNEVQTYSIDQNLVLFSACFTEAGNILFGTQENVHICRLDNDSIISINTIEGFDYSNILAIQKLKDKDSYLIGTDGNGLFHLRITPDGNLLARFRNYPQLEPLRIQSITEDSENNLWISTFGSGILQLRLNEKDETIESIRFFDKNSGLPGNDIKLVFQDIESDYWIGLYGNGLSLLNSVAFSFYSPGSTPETKNIIYINKINQDYFLGTPSGFYLFDLGNYNARSFTDLRQKTGKNEIISYCLDNERNIWIGTNGGGLFVRNNSGGVSQFFRSEDSGQNYVSDVEVDGKNIWLGTLNGVIILDRKRGNPKDTFNINNGLPHNSINQIFLTGEGKAAIATTADKLFLIDPDSGISSANAIMYGATMNKILSFTQDKDGVFWAATSGNGIFKCYNDSVKSLSRADQLMSDYCYSILADSRNKIWIGHERGFSIYNQETGIVKVLGTDFASGGACNPDGMYESDDGKILIGTTEGIIVFDRSKEQKDMVPPFNNINYITINNTRYPYQASYNLPYRKSYKIVVNYVGINFSDPGKVFYITKLDNWDTDWSKLTTDREIPYSPRDGRYKFNMISVNEEGFSQDTPVSFELHIKKPLWRTWWFIISLACFIAGIIVLIVREREKAQKKIQAYLEQELEARTRVVMKQKAELELQNIEITDSINYAKRIQTSILPDINRLKESFKDAFIFFRPRDIVSGDFYWFDKLGDDKFILVCADSTGHGVPGAFMSMIGSTLLQDVVSRQHITKPSEILTILNKQIFSTLNQNIELGVSNDGMDMVVCEISIKTRHIRFASAMRPVIVVIGGESFYIKGNRSSVGGESVIEKFFDDQEYYLNEGDTIYMFSDGLPDQFGGPYGKKMKIVRLRTLIEAVVKLPMDEQKEKILKYFDDWKGISEQVDDVLMMGIKI